MSDLDATITIARDELRLLPKACERAWSWDLGRLDHPDLDSFKAGRQRKGRKGSPDPWDPDRSQLDVCYVKAMQHIARGLREIVLHCDERPEEDPACDLVGTWLDDLLQRPAREARVPSMAEVRAACRLLSGWLEWARGEHKSGSLVPQERTAVEAACSEAMAARDEFPRSVAEPWRTCNEDGCLRPPERRRATCRQHRSDRAAA